MSRKPYVPAGLLFGAVLSGLREIAFGKETVRKTKQTLDRAERMRDDDKLLFLAEEKRLRKMAKRAKG